MSTWRVGAAGLALVVGLLTVGCSEGSGEEASGSTSADASSTAAMTSTSAAPSTTTRPTSTTATSVTAAAESHSPCGDSRLDGMYTACAEGDWVACDDLFRNAPAWSVCQRFGDTCGNTTTTPHDARCQDLYAGVVVPHENWPGLP